jgi:hypothetical protein
MEPGRVFAGNASVQRAERRHRYLERDDSSSNRHLISVCCSNMILSENRFPLFRIMLQCRAVFERACLIVLLDGFQRQRLEVFAVTRFTITFGAVEQAIAIDESLFVGDFLRAGHF